MALSLLVVLFLQSFCLGAAAPLPSTKGHEVYTWGNNNVGQLGVVDYEDRSVPTQVRVLRPKRFVQLSMGGSQVMEGHTLALARPGKVFSAGDNSFGQLGLGDTQDRDLLLPIPSIFHEEFAMVSAGEAHSVALTTDGRIFAWGSNVEGQLGVPDVRHMSAEPIEVPMPKGSDRSVVFAGISTRHAHTIAWTTSGRLYAWGGNAHGQLGSGDREPFMEPRLVGLPWKERVKMAVAGGAHTLVLMESGHVYGWGQNVYGQLGLEKDAFLRDVLSPERIPFFSALKVKSLAAGASHSMFLMQDSTLYGCGDNYEGQVGVGPASNSSPTTLHTPQAVNPGSRFLGAVCGSRHTLGWLEGGRMLAWGANEAGQLGVGDSRSRSLPESVAKMGGSENTVRVVGAGWGSTMAVTTDGMLFGWGKNNAGQLGRRASKLAKKNPEFIANVQEATRIRQVAAGGYAYQYEGHTLALTESGEVLAWGWNAFGQLGVGEVGTSESVPQRIPWLARQPIRWISAGQFASAAVTTSGEVLTWGSNEAGQLGRGDFTLGTVDAPQRIKLDSQATMVSVGYAHMLLLTSDGQVYSWGRNSFGQLGLGDHKDRAEPEHIATLAGESIVGIAAGQSHSLAVSARGLVFGWGYNQDYELGLGDNMDRVVPQQVAFPASLRARSVAAGAYHSLAVSDDGQLFGWGLNNHAQLGKGRDRSPGRLPSPISISADSDEGRPQAGERIKVKEAAAGTWHSVAVLEGGGIYAWGRCHLGQVGIPCERERDVDYPRRVEHLGEKVVVAVAVGAAHTVVAVESSSANNAKANQ